MWTSILVSVALSVISFALQSRIKQARPPQAAEMENPTASAGKPLPVVFGTVMVKAPNNLGYWDKRTED